MTICPRCGFNGRHSTKVCYPEDVPLTNEELQANLYFQLNQRAPTRSYYPVPEAPWHVRLRDWLAWKIMP